MGDINELMSARDKHNATVKAERVALEARAKAGRLSLNERIAARRAELEKVTRFLAAEKPRSRKGNAL